MAVVADPNRGDPLVIVDVDTHAVRELAVGTVNNSDPVVHDDAATGRWRVAWVSQGVRSSSEQAWRRVYLQDIPAP